MVDLLKFTFNILVQYPRMVGADGKGKGKEAAAATPKVAGELWSDNLEK